MSPGCCTGIMERVAKINGVIPDRSLVTVDQRALHLDGGEVTFSIEKVGTAGLRATVCEPPAAMADQLVSDPICVGVPLYIYR
jgi:hypothetical protein